MTLANKQPRADSNPDPLETLSSYQHTMGGVTLSFIHHSYGTRTGALYCKLQRTSDWTLKAAPFLMKLPQTQEAGAALRP